MGRSTRTAAIGWVLVLALLGCSGEGDPSAASSGPDPAQVWRFGSGSVFEKNGEILERRHTVYQDARRRNPERWSRETRNWTPDDAVELLSYRSTMVQTNQETNKAA